MKTLNNWSWTWNFLCLIAAAIVFTACSKDGGGGGGGGGGTTASTPQNQYVMTNGTCYLNNQPVAYNLCQNNGYTWNGNSCLDSAGRPVAVQYCQNSGFGGYGQGGYGYSFGYAGGYGYVPGQCYGVFFAPNDVGGMMYRCSGYNCSGFTMVDVVTGQTRQCR